MALTTKRSVITLFTNKDDLYSHQVLIVLCEKSLNFSIVEVEPDNNPSFG